jgi:hypothetical protein
LRVAGNRFDVRELNGAFGDLGTLIPFVLGYVTVDRLDPAALAVSQRALATPPGPARRGARAGPDADARKREDDGGGTRCSPFPWRS